MFPDSAKCQNVPELSSDRRKVERLEEIMLKQPQVDIPVSHTFGPGFYARTIEIKAGTVLTGKVHLTEHVFILSRGSMELLTDEGSIFVDAPFHSISKPGLKRAGYAHTDCVCTNVHVTEVTDLGKLEEMLVITRPLIETKEPE